MSSILVFGTTQQNRQAAVEKILAGLELKISENNPDLLFINPLEKKKSIGIGQIREATKFLNEKPFSHQTKAVVVNKAGLLTEEAQNALLKTLEEPPSYATIILNAKTENSLLETVVSRCRKIKADEVDFEVGDSDEEASLVESVLEKNLGERLSWAAEFSKQDRESVIESLEGWVGQLRKDLNEKSAENIEVILLVKADLEKTNVSLKLALEYLVLKLK